MTTADLSRLTILAERVTIRAAELREAVADSDFSALAHKAIAHNASLVATCNRHLLTNQRLRDEIATLEKRIQDMGGTT